MIVGVGTDILKIQRLRNALSGDSSAFIDDCFTKYEQTQAAKRSDPVIYYSTRFAGKEAVFKCLGVHPDSVTTLNEIEISELETGQPIVNLYGNLSAIAAGIGVSRIDISLSYEDEYAIAFAVAHSYESI